MRLLPRRGRHRVRTRHDIGRTQFERRGLTIRAFSHRCAGDAGPQFVDLAAQSDDLALKLLDARGQFAGWAQDIGRNRLGRWFVRDARYLSAVFGFYALAKAAEFWDRAIFSGLTISGHSIKHVLAAIATYFIFRWRLAGAEKASRANVPNQPAHAAFR